MKKERLKEIDILRAFAFIFVVAQHTLGGFSNIKGISYFDFTVMKLIYVMAKPAVPIFLFISAVSLFYVYSNKFDWKKYYIKRIKYVLIPYAIWSAINMFELGSTERFNNFIVQIIAGNGAFHLWYMGTILRLYLIFPVILWAARKIHMMNLKIRVFTFTLLSILYYLVSKYQNIISDKISFFIFRNPTEIQHRIINISILFWFLYFVLGIYFALNHEYIKKKILQHRIIIIIIYLLLFIYAYLNEVEKIEMVRALSIIYPIFSILAFYIISVSLIDINKIYRSMKFIGDYSFASYMAHIIVINYVVNYIRIDYHIKNYLLLGILAWIITAISTPILFILLVIYHIQNI